MRKLRVVIDTNVLRKTINRANDEFFIYQAFESELFNWVVSTEILDEYEEKLIEFFSVKTANLVLGILCNANNTIFAEPYFHWNLIQEAPDDNKFSDLALSTNADYLVTFDKHFNIFKTINFPKLNVVNPSEFKTILENMNLKNT